MWPMQQRLRFPRLLAASLFLLLAIESTWAVPFQRKSGLSENVYIIYSNDTGTTEERRVCEIDGVRYQKGESIPSSDVCEECVCHPPGFACTITNCQHKSGCKAIQRSNQCCPEFKCECEKDGRIYQNGDRIVDLRNPCHVCFCQGGEVRCSEIQCYWRSDCKPRFLEHRCCPIYEHCPPIVPFNPATPISAGLRPQLSGNPLVSVLSEAALSSTTAAPAVPSEASRLPEVVLPVTRSTAAPTFTPQVTSIPPSTEAPTTAKLPEPVIPEKVDQILEVQEILVDKVPEPIPVNNVPEEIPVDKIAEASPIDNVPEAPATGPVYVPEAPAESSVYVPEAPAESPVYVPEAPAESPVYVPEAPAESPVYVPEAPEESSVYVPEEPAESPVYVPEAPAKSPVKVPEAPVASQISGSEAPEEIPHPVTDAPEAATSEPVNIEESPVQKLPEVIPAQEVSVLIPDEIVTDKIPSDQVLEADDKIIEEVTAVPVDQVPQETPGEPKPPAIPEDDLPQDLPKDELPEQVPTVPEVIILEKVPVQPEANPVDAGEDEVVPEESPIDKSQDPVPVEQEQITTEKLPEEILIVTEAVVPLPADKIQSDNQITPEKKPEEVVNDVVEVQQEIQVPEAAITKAPEEIVIADEVETEQPEKVLGEEIAAPLTEQAQQVTEEVPIAADEVLVAVEIPTNAAANKISAEVPVAHDAEDADNEPNDEDEKIEEALPATASPNAVQEVPAQPSQQAPHDAVEEVKSEAPAVEEVTTLLPEKEVPAVEASKPTDEASRPQGDFVQEMVNLIEDVGQVSLTTTQQTAVKEIIKDALDSSDGIVLQVAGTTYFPDGRQPVTAEPGKPEADSLIGEEEKDLPEVVADTTESDQPQDKEVIPPAIPDVVSSDVIHISEDMESQLLGGTEEKVIIEIEAPPPSSGKESDGSVLIAIEIATTPSENDKLSSETETAPSVAPGLPNKEVDVVADKIMDYGFDSSNAEVEFPEIPDSDENVEQTESSYVLKSSEISTEIPVPSQDLTPPEVQEPVINQELQPPSALYNEEPLTVTEIYKDEEEAPLSEDPSAVSPTELPQIIADEGVKEEEKQNYEQAPLSSEVSSDSPTESPQITTDEEVKVGDQQKEEKVPLSDDLSSDSPTESPHIPTDEEVKEAEQNEEKVPHSDALSSDSPTESPQITTDEEVKEADKYEEKVPHSDDLSSDSPTESPQITTDEDVKEADKYEEKVPHSDDLSSDSPTELPQVTANQEVNEEPGHKSGEETPAADELSSDSPTEPPQIADQRVKKESEQELNKDDIPSITDSPAADEPATESDQNTELPGEGKQRSEQLSEEANTDAPVQNPVIISDESTDPSKTESSSDDFKSLIETVDAQPAAPEDKKPEADETIVESTTPLAGEEGRNLAVSPDNKEEPAGDSKVAELELTTEAEVQGRSESVTTIRSDVDDADSPGSQRALPRSEKPDDQQSSTILPAIFDQSLQNFDDLEEIFRNERESGEDFSGNILSKREQTTPLIQSNEAGQEGRANADAISYTTTESDKLAKKSRKEPEISEGTTEPASVTGAPELRGLLDEAKPDDSVVTEKASESTAQLPVEDIEVAESAPQLRSIEASEATTEVPNAARAEIVEATTSDVQVQGRSDNAVSESQTVQADAKSEDTTRPREAKLDADEDTTKAQESSVTEDPIANDPSAHQNNELPPVIFADEAEAHGEVTSGDEHNESTPEYREPRLEPDSDRTTTDIAIEEKGDNAQSFTTPESSTDASQPQEVIIPKHSQIVLTPPKAVSHVSILGDESDQIHSRSPRSAKKYFKTKNKKKTTIPEKPKLLDRVVRYIADKFYFF